mmetsp:Transcript_123527/g.231066  ORF Transcript_123527/g.231066 Transcript_123527/m.231066 type:complete len:347 (-) Transcript_123527:80-1120(-)
MASALAMQSISSNESLCAPDPAFAVPLSGSSSSYERFCPAIEAGQASQDAAKGSGAAPNAEASNAGKQQESKEPQPILQPGVAVIMYGLTGAAELNGRPGQCEQWVAESGRWRVRLESGEHKDIKSGNLALQSTQSLSSMEGKQLLRKGIAVVIHGLSGAKELNGLKAHCEQWLEESGRWRVRLESGEHKDIKPGSLALQSVQPEASAPSTPSAGASTSAGASASSAGGSSSSSGSAARLVPGARVTLQGLQGAASLNGRMATVMRFDSAAGRYVVDLYGGGGQKSLRAENLIVAGAASGASATGACRREVNLTPFPGVFEVLAELTFDVAEFLRSPWAHTTVGHA